MLKEENLPPCSHIASSLTRFQIVYNYVVIDNVANILEQEKKLHIFLLIFSSNAVTLLKLGGNQHICRTPNNAFAVCEATNVL